MPYGRDMGLGCQGGKMLRQMPHGPCRGLIANRHNVPPDRTFRDSRAAAAAEHYRT